MRWNQILKPGGCLETDSFPGIEAVGYDGFVELACANDKIQNWL